jgi:hypothetical protein
MATILEFRSAPRPAPASQFAMESGQMAEIVFFPGIRYERAEEEKTTKPKRTRRQHDTIEIEN